MEKVLKFNEFINNFDFDYDYIIKEMVRKFGYGNTISNKISEFEQSDDFKQVTDNDSYIYQFNSFLMNLSPNTEYLSVAEPISWYSKLT